MYGSLCLLVRLIVLVWFMVGYFVLLCSYLFVTDYLCCVVVLDWCGIGCLRCVVCLLFDVL